VHGDWASIDEDGEWFLHGRSDDTIKLAGKRLGPAEVESAAVSHPFVVVAAPGAPADLREQVAGVVAERLGKSFKPSAVKLTSALPKTRNAKVLRRAVRAVALDRDPGDLSSLEDPSTI